MQNPDSNMKTFQIDTGLISEDEGMPVNVAIDNDVWEFPPGDFLKGVGGIRINGYASIVSGYLLVMGDFEADFELRCDRCSEPFIHTVKLGDHALQAELENSRIVDLTDALREDILLALPAYPHCDDASGSPQCPANDSFPEIDEFAELDELDEEGNLIEPDVKPNVWDALNHLKTDKD
jgi:uncharacterized protein